MAKVTGLGDNLYIGGRNVSGIVQSVGRVSGGFSTIDMTDITQSATSRKAGILSGQIDMTVYFDPGGWHSALAALPTTSTLISYQRGTSIGSPSACLVAKQLNYDPTRAADGSLTLAVNSTGSDGYPLEWGEQLTGGVRGDTGATNGASLDGTASSAFGAQFYLHVFAFTGTDATVKIQSSADNSTWADLTGGAFAQTTTAPGWQRIATATGATIPRYLRVVTVTTGGFTSLQFAVTAVRNQTAITY